ncbi:hypothetical protein Lal_00028397 [Lupinus albus]|nr:hypothetical protein Lal_00028397 [Lupinus albus]
MTSKSFLGEGSNINCPPSFVGECYDFWKIIMRIFIESQVLDIWSASEEEPCIPFVVVNGVREPKHSQSKKLISLGSLSWARELSPGRERLTWEGEILSYTEGFSLEREWSRLSESGLA